MGGAAGGYLTYDLPLTKGNAHGAIGWELAGCLAYDGRRWKNQ